VEVKAGKGRPLAMEGLKAHKKARGKKGISAQVEA
jgi:hypothetical protein